MALFFVQNLSASIALSKHSICSNSESRKALSRESAPHGLLRRVERRSCKPFCLRGVRQMGKEQLEQSPALDVAGRQQILYELEHRLDVPLLGFTVFGDEKNHGGQEALGGIIEEGVLPSHGHIEVSGGYDGLGGDLGVLLRSGFIREILRVRSQAQATGTPLQEQ